MAGPLSKTPELISQYARPEWTSWAYCSDELGCGHNVKIDIAAIIARVGDIRPAGSGNGSAARSVEGGRGW
jgi:hypothetical protein